MREQMKVHSFPIIGGHTKRVITVSMLPLLILVLWGITDSLIARQTFVGPVEAFSSLGVQLSQPRFYGQIGYTLVLLGASYLLSVVIGAAAGFLLGLNPALQRIASLLLYGMYSIPKVTLYPLFLLFFGLGPIGEIAFVFAHGIFPMTVIVMDATTLVRTRYAKVAVANGASYRQYISLVVLPSTIPAFTTALRICFSVTFLAVIVAELFSSNQGLGAELRKNLTLTRLDNIVGIVIVIAIVAVVLSSLLRMVEKLVHQHWGSTSSLSADAGGI